MDDKLETSGLAGVMVAETRLSEVDGEAGRLIIGGSAVEGLAGTTGFGALAERLLSVRDAEAQLLAGRRRAFERLPRLGDALDRADGMDALRAALAHETGRLPSLGGPRAAWEREEALALMGAMATYAAAWARRRQGLSPVAPAAADHAADYLAMLTGRSATEAEARAMASYLVTVSDHGMNASTFAARVATSTGSDLVSALVAGVGTLKGPLHGGAPGPVLDMLDAIGAPERARAWLEGELAAGRRIMGMGHRIYRVRDPRAHVLERAIQELTRARADSPRLALALRVEREAERLLAERHPERPLRANVEFYTAVLLEALTLDRAAFSPTFAVGRSVGWCAHVLEQRAWGKLIRPEARYVGPRP